MKARSFFVRVMTTAAGAVLIIYGVIAAISPLPLGVPLIILGLFMIVAANPAAKPLVHKLRLRWRWFDRLAAAIGERAPDHVKKW